MTGAGKWPSEGLEPVARCPLCAGEQRSILYRELIDRVSFSAPGTWTLYRCHGCGCGYLHPRPTQQSIGLAYSGYYTHEATSAPTEWWRAPPRGRERLAWALRAGYLNRRYGYSFRPAIDAGRLILPLFIRTRERADRWARHLRRPKPGATLLDVGCGDGWFLREMQTVGWSVSGLDPDPEAVAVARASGLAVREGMLEDGVFADGHFDAITLNHVVEHLPDPVGTLSVCRRILKPGGLIWVSTPNLGSRGHALFGEDWRGLEPPRHLVLFTRAALVRALSDAGFDVVRLPAIHVAGWMFRQSRAISRGLAPGRNVPPLPRRWELKARLADLRALWQPSVAEEVTVLARKPQE